MISNNLLDELQKLNRAEKLHVIRFLVDDLSTEEAYFAPQATYEVWSPYDAPAAAHALLNMLEVNQTNDR